MDMKFFAILLPLLMNLVTLLYIVMSNIKKDRDEAFISFLSLLQSLLFMIKSSRGRNAGYPAPPAQTRTCGFPASGSSVVLAFAQSNRAMQTLDAVWR